MGRFPSPVSSSAFLGGTPFVLLLYLPDIQVRLIGYKSCCDYYYDFFYYLYHIHLSPPFYIFIITYLFIGCNRYL